MGRGCIVVLVILKLGAGHKLRHPGFRKEGYPKSFHYMTQIERVGGQQKMKNINDDNGE